MPVDWDDREHWGQPGTNVTITGSGVKGKAHEDDGGES